ncbi:hypothetical protein H5410_043219 [Solanum commersonii]|uniref:Uncharacterized protein n=1 Tax=Solanum commersonii TaxID=4109 RepID=A0A9J5XWY3_SOLCO|nr:hypothetical protein H5410_043219 [Solanum commersonii]
MSESVLMTVQRDILYNDFVNSIISYCGLNCQPNDLVISYMHKSFENQRVLPFKISNQLRLSAYLSDATRSVLRVYVVENLIENENIGQDQQNLLNDELNGMNMNIPDDEIGHDILEREIPPSYVDPSKPGRRRTKRRRGVGESFSTRKNKCSICKNIGHKRTTCSVRNAP